MNPFEIVCLVTATAASKDVRDDLVYTKTKGEDVYRSFGRNRTNTEESALIFQDRIPQQKIKTFSDMQLCSRMKATQREVLIKADQMLFVHAVYILGYCHDTIFNQSYHIFHPQKHMFRDEVCGSVIISSWGMEYPIFSFSDFFRGGHFENAPGEGAHHKFFLLTLQILILQAVSFEKNISL